jgi:hypothetical protein
LTLLDGELVEINDGENVITAYYDAKKHLLQTFEDKQSGKGFFRYPTTLGKTIPITTGLNIHITGPILGYDLLMPIATTQAGQKERSLFANE